MSDTKMKKVFDDIFDSIMEESKAKAMSHPVFDWLVENKEWTKEPYDFTMEVLYPLRSVINMAIQRCNDLHYKNKSLFCSFFTDYTFYEMNLSGIFCSLYGRAFSVDRSRFLIRYVMQYCVDGETPDFITTDWWVPPSGSKEEWIAFVNGLHGMLYGKPKRYMEAYKALIDADKEKFN